jgi:hypothetical protein
MRRTCSLALFLIAACPSDPQQPPEDLCDPAIAAKVTPGGSVQLGLGDDSASVVEGQQVPLVCGTQGGTMFLVNARVQGLDVSADQVGAIDFIATASSGANLTAVSAGCRVRQFKTAGDGSLQLTSSYGLQLDPAALQQMQIDGTRIQIVVKVRDRFGLQATDMRTVVAKLPGPCGGA